jgi:hypothetical protein
MEDVSDQIVRILERCNHLAAISLVATSRLTMVHLDQAILERRQIDISLLLGIQLLP